MSKKTIQAILSVTTGFLLFGTTTALLETSTTNSAEAAAKTSKKAKTPKKYKIGHKYYTMKQMRSKYNLHFKQTKSRGAYNQYDGKQAYAASGTYNAFTGKNKSKQWTSKKTKYYSFSSAYLVKSGKKSYWNYGTHSIDMKTGHMYTYLSIGSAGGKG
ncbi:hypothetical protein [Levilactobacillus cerevisiae]|uniref:hypothetical protein n=1 Tax=Levilactobacillus cerevisiae TaxID=1704076 RepID=UPI000F7AEEEE|nr:hypothetical protein [Levilactobacillus cerevisiae]